MFFYCILNPKQSQFHFCWEISHACLVFWLNKLVRVNRNVAFWACHVLVLLAAGSQLFNNSAVERMSNKMKYITWRQSATQKGWIVQYKGKTWGGFHASIKKAKLALNQARAYHGDTVPAETKKKGLHQSNTIMASAITKVISGMLVTLWLLVKPLRQLRKLSCNFARCCVSKRIRCLHQIAGSLRLESCCVAWNVWLRGVSLKLINNGFLLISRPLTNIAAGHRPRPCTMQNQLWSVRPWVWNTCHGRMRCVKLGSCWNGPRLSSYLCRNAQRLSLKCW